MVFEDDELMPQWLTLGPDGGPSNNEVLIGPVSKAQQAQGGEGEGPSTAFIRAKQPALPGQNYWYVRQYVYISYFLVVFHIEWCISDS